MKLAPKLMTTYLSVGLLPLAAIGAIAWFVASTALEEVSSKGEGGLVDTNAQGSTALEAAAFGQLTAMREIKARQIGGFFAERKGDLAILTDTVAALKDQAFEKLQVGQQHKVKQLQDFFGKVNVDVLTLAKSQGVLSIHEELAKYHTDTNVQATGNYDVSTDAYSKIWDVSGGFLGEYVKSHGYYDVFIICATHGHVMYTAARESDLGKNLGHGELKNSGLAHVWRHALETKTVAYSDFEPYAPSNGDQAAFVGAPIRDASGAVVAVLALQLPTDPINAIAHQREGMGRTGESFLVGRNGGKTSYRSDRVVKKGRIGSPKSDGGIEDALAGNGSARIIVGSTGAVEAEACAPLNLPGLEWCIVTTMALEEILAPRRAGVEKDFFAQYIEKNNYYDLFLITPDGHCFCTVCHESDYQTNLVSGKYSTSGLGHAVRQSLQDKAFAFADFAPYAPSNGQPAAFIAQPLLGAGRNVELVVALQLSDTAISEMMAAGSDKEKTLEAYMVGPDGHMRSDSILHPDSYGVLASFTKNNKVDTEAIRDAMGGGTNTRVITDYLGSAVLSAWQPLDILGVKWALICEIDAAVAMAAKTDMEKTAASATKTMRETRATANGHLVAWVVGALLVSAALVSLLAWSIARGISRPILEGVTRLTVVASEGDLSTDVPQDQRGRQDEIGELGRAVQGLIDFQRGEVQVANSFAEGNWDVEVPVRSDRDGLAQALNTMVAQVNNALTGTLDSSMQINSGASQVSDASQSLSQGATESAASLEEITSSMTQMGSQTRTNAENATQASQLAASARNSAKTGAERMAELMDAMGEIDQSSQQISKIIKTIDDIAFQTNLLALNAAVEAARAGRHGKGFAVVAEEVRNLASRSAKAAKETSELIEASAKKVENGKGIAGVTSEALGEIVDSVTKTTDLVAEIAAASNEQAQGIAQVNQGLQQIDSVTQQNTANAEETAAAAEELSGQADMLQQILSKFRLRKQLSQAAALTAPLTGAERAKGPKSVDRRRLAPSRDDSWGGQARGRQGRANDCPR